MKNKKLLLSSSIRRMWMLCTLPFLLVAVPDSYATGKTDRSVPNTNLTPVVLLLDWTPNTNHIGAYVALEKGYFLNEGIDLRIHSISEASVEFLVGSRKADFGFSYQESLTFARASETPTPIVAIAAVIAHNTSGFAAPAASNIASPKDFVGKKYGAFGSPSEAPTLDTIMKPYAKSSKDVIFVPAGALDFFQGTHSGAFDFAWIFAGWTGIEATIRGVDIYFEYLKDIDPSLDYYSPVLISSQSLIEENPTLVQSFVNAIQKGYEWSIAQPTEAADILLAHAPELDSKLVHASAKFLAPLFAENNPNDKTTRTLPWGIMKDSVWHNYTKWLQENNFIEKTFSIEGAYTNQFISNRTASPTDASD